MVVLSVAFFNVGRWKVDQHWCLPSKNSMPLTLWAPNLVLVND